MSKHDQGKYKPSLIYTSLLKAISPIRLHGAKKYGSLNDWKGNKPIQHLDAAIRHIRSAIDGEDFDKDSGFLHIALAATNLMFEIERIKDAFKGD